MANPRNRHIDTPGDEGLGSIVLEIHISPKDLVELRDVLAKGAIQQSSNVADQFIQTFGSVLEHTESVIEELDRDFYEDLMTRIGPKSIN